MLHGLWWSSGLRPLPSLQHEEIYTRQCRDSRASPLKQRTFADSVNVNVSLDQSEVPREGKEGKLQASRRWKACTDVSGQLGIAQIRLSVRPHVFWASYEHRLDRAMLHQSRSIDRDELIYPV